MATANEVYREYVTDGLPASGRNQPSKSEIRALLTGYERTMDSFVAGDSVTKETWPLLNATTGNRDGQRGYVPDDAGTHVDPVTSATVSNAGLYIWVEESAAWKWLKADDYTVLHAGLDTEEAARVEAVFSLQNNIDAETQARETAIAAETQARETAIAAETQARETAIAQEVIDRNAAIAALVDSSPAALDTLNELAAALGDDPNFAATTAEQIGQKLAKSLNLSDLPNAATARSNLGLGTAAVRDDDYFATAAEMAEAEQSVATEATARADADTATNEKIDESLPVSNTASLKVPVVIDEATGKVLVWIEDGKIHTIDRPDQLAFVGNKVVPVLADRNKILAWLENGLLETILRPEQQPFNGNKHFPMLTDGGKILAWFENGLLETISRVDQQPFNGNQVFPILTDGGKILAWLENGLLNAAPVGAGFARNVDVMSSRFASFGASLNRWRAALAKYRVSQSNRVKILIAGDSWVEQSYISAAIKEVLGGELAADGFHPPVNGGEITTSSFSKTGTWTLLDGSGTSDYPYGIGPSGYQIYTDATDATATLADFYGTNIRIYHHNHGGTWRYQIDSGAWTTVNDTSDGLMEYVEVSGLSDDLHTLEIDTIGNTGVVAIDGFYSWRDGISGFEVSRLGNGGVRSTGMARWHEELVQFAQDMQPDLMITILGTNDQWSTPPDDHYASIMDLVTKTRAAMPDIGFVHIVPPQSDPSGYDDGTHVAEYKLTAYRDATRRIVRDAGTEYLSLVDLMADWDTENARGLWDNWGHLNGNGARVLADLLNTHFLKL